MEECTFLKPERTADDEMVQDPETGETVCIIEHFKQGDYKYKITWKSPGWEGTVEEEK